MGGIMGRPLSEHVGIAANILVIFVAGAVLVRPDNSLGAWWTARKESVRIAREVRAAWGDLTSEGGQIGAPLGQGPVIVEFGDYECPYCRASHESVKRMLSNGTTVTVVYRHMPLAGIHPKATDAARMSICAERLGAFDRVHASLYEADAWRAVSDWAAVTDALETSDRRALVECLQSNAPDARLSRDLQLADRLGIKSTPSFVGLGGVHAGILTAEVLQRITGGVTHVPQNAKEASGPR